MRIPDSREPLPNEEITQMKTTPGFTTHRQEESKTIKDFQGTVTKKCRDWAYRCRIPNPITLNLVDFNCDQLRTFSNGPVDR